MGYKHNIDDIIAKGSELIRKKGYHHVGINEILKACEIPKGSFYNFFDSKEDFAHKILDRYGQQNLEMIKLHLHAKTPTPLHRLRNFYAMLITSNEEDGFDAGCLVNNMSIELGGINKDLGQTADKSFKLWVGAIAKCVKEGQALGEIKEDMPAEDLAEYLHAGFFGALARMKANANRVYLDKWYTMTFEFIKA